MLCAPRDAAAADTRMAIQAAHTSPANGRYAAVNGLKMYYEIHGAGRPLVLLHGGLATIDTSLSGADWGANLPHSPVFGGRDPSQPTLTFIVPVPRWSDGTPAPGSSNH